jgi:hypothetical protein
VARLKIEGIRSEMKRKLVTFFALGMAAMLPMAFGSTMPITPGGGAVSVPANGSTFPGSLVADTGVVALTPGLGSSITATGEERVYLTSTGLDFFIQVTNNNQTNGTDNLSLVDARNFAGFTTAVAYLTLPSGGVAPALASRAAPGDTVNFYFVDSSGRNDLGSMAPSGLGNTSDWLEIDTNATGLAFNGSIGVQDGGVASMLAYSPVPEPTTTGVLCGAMALIFIARRRAGGRRLS